MWILLGERLITTIELVSKFITCSKRSLMNFSKVVIYIVIFLREKLPTYSSSIMAVERTTEIRKITTRSVDHLAVTTSTRAIHASPSSPLPRWRRAKLVVVDRKEVVVRTHRTSAPKQEAPPMKKVVDRKDQTNKHHKDEQRPDPNRFIEDQR